MSDDFSALAYSVERTYPVDVDQMWRAWTDARALEQWYAPTDLHVVPGSVVSDAVEGGRWAVAVDATAYGHIAYFWGRYDDVSPGSRLIHTLSYSQNEADFIAHDDDATAARGCASRSTATCPLIRPRWPRRAWRAISTRSAVTWPSPDCSARSQALRPQLK